MEFLQGKINRCHVIFWFLIIVGSLVSVVVRTFDISVQGEHNSDSITHSLASFDVWSPYFYGQDRLGMLFSLPGMWISDPVDNLLFLNALFIGFVFLMFPVWGYWLTRSKSGVYGGVLAAILYTLLGDGRAVFVTSVEHPEYAGAIMLGFTGMILLDQVRDMKMNRRALMFEITGGAFLMLASWVNITIPIFLGGFYVLRWLYYRTRWKFLCMRVGLLFAAFAVVLVTTKLLVKSEMNTSVAIVGLGKWWLNLKCLVVNSVSEFHDYWLIAGVGLVCLLVLFLVKNDKHKVPVSSLVCYTGGIGFLGFLAILQHVGAPHHGECRSCYSVATVFAILLGGGIAIQRVLELAKVKYVHPVLALTGCVYLCLTVGAPSKEKVVGEFERKWGGWRDLMVKYDCTHIGGNSWFTYDVMFYTNYHYYLNGSDKRLYPYTFRDTPYREDALEVIGEEAKLGICYGYAWDNDYFYLNSRDNGVRIDTVDLADEDGFQVHRIVREIEKRDE